MSEFLADQPDPEAMLAVLRRGAFEVALLLELDFASGPLRICDWTVPVTDLRWGHAWIGARGLVGMSDVSGSSDDLAPVRQYQLGIPYEWMTEEERGRMGMLPALLADRSEYVGRDAVLYLQLFDGRDAHGRAAPIGYPIALDWGVMDRLSGSYGSGGVSLSLSVEGLLARKGAPIFGLLTHRDQMRRHPGDEGLRFVPEVVSTNPVWTTW